LTERHVNFITTESLKSGLHFCAKWRNVSSPPLNCSLLSTVLCGCNSGQILCMMTHMIASWWCIICYCFTWC